MTRTYHYHGFMLEVTIESHITFRPTKWAQRYPIYVAVVRLTRDDDDSTPPSPLKFDAAGGRPFDSEADALMGGYSEARKVIDELYRSRQ